MWNNKMICDAGFVLGADAFLSQRNKELEISLGGFSYLKTVRKSHIEFLRGVCISVALYVSSFVGQLTLLLSGPTSNLVIVFYNNIGITKIIPSTI